MSFCARTTSGYTLLELVLVLAILAIALAAVAPTLSGFASGRQAENTARQFVGLTRFARSQAVSDGIAYQILLQPDNGSWQLQMQEMEGQPFAEMPGPFGRVFTVPEGVTMTTDVPAVDGVQAINFDASGRSDVGVIHFVGPNSDIVVECDAPVEEYRILKDSEVKQ